MMLQAIQYKMTSKYHSHESRGPISASRLPHPYTAPQSYTATSNLSDQRPWRHTSDHPIRAGGVVTRSNSAFNYSPESLKQPHSFPQLTPRDAARSRALDSRPPLKPFHSLDFDRKGGPKLGVSHGDGSDKPFLSSCGNMSSYGGGAEKPYHGDGSFGADKPSLSSHGDRSDYGDGSYGADKPSPLSSYGDGSYPSKHFSSSSGYESSNLQSMQPSSLGSFQPSLRTDTSYDLKHPSSLGSIQPSPKTDFDASYQSKYPSSLGSTQPSQKTDFDASYQSKHPGSYSTSEPSLRTDFNTSSWSKHPSSLDSYSTIEPSLRTNLDSSSQPKHPSSLGSYSTIQPSLSDSSSQPKHPSSLGSHNRSYVEPLSYDPQSEHQASVYGKPAIRSGPVHDGPPRHFLPAGSDTPSSLPELHERHHRVVREGTDYPVTSQPRSTSSSLPSQPRSSSSSLPLDRPSSSSLSSQSHRHHQGRQQGPPVDPSTGMSQSYRVASEAQDLGKGRGGVEGSFDHEERSRGGIPSHLIGVEGTSVEQFYQARGGGMSTESSRHGRGEAVGPGGSDGPPPQVRSQVDWTAHPTHHDSRGPTMPPLPHPITASSVSHTPRPPSSKCCSMATLENERYSLDGISRPDHDNEDRHFAIEGQGFKVFAVFDGHDGPRAAGFACNSMHQVFNMQSWSRLVDNPNPGLVQEMLGELFKDTEKEFFRSIQRYILEKESLQRIIPQHLSSYAAFQQFPNEVSRLQEVEPKLSGGCTAVLAILVNDRLYVANVGDSRALLVYETPNKTLGVMQLSVDHSVENEEELKRLDALGLDPNEIIKSGRLGMHENFRSIGDYSIKQGYKDVDTLRRARSPPGIATPYIMPPRTVDHTYKYLILMTDGVYKSIESGFEQQQSIESNKVLTNILETSERRVGLGRVSDSILERICKVHRDTYEDSARKDPRSPRAVECRKRDDMTLVVYKFPDSR